MSYLISCEQFATIKDRQILDAILIAKEAVDEYRARKEGFLFKVDFKKASDHVEWSFVDNVLKQKGFGEV